MASLLHPAVPENTRLPDAAPDFHHRMLPCTTRASSAPFRFIQGKPQHFHEDAGIRELGRVAMS